MARFDGFVSLDWGFNAPFACYWWYCLPDGRLHIRREWKGRETFAEDFAKGFWKITREEIGWDRPRYVVVGGDVKSRIGMKGPKGQTVWDTLVYHKLPLRDADKDRVNGWYRVHELLKLSPFGTPWLTVDPSCKYLLRTIAAAPRDQKEEDELDPKFTDDHGLESVRYGAMSRPSPTRILDEMRQMGPMHAGTLLKDALVAATATQTLGHANVRGR